MVVTGVSVPEVPVMVNVTVPGVAELLAVNVSVLVPVVGFGVNTGVTPLGRPEVTARLTLPVNPFVGFTVTVLVPLLPVPPGLIGPASAVSESVKFGGGVTVSMIVVFAVTLPEVPVMVIGYVPGLLAEALAVSVKVLVVVVLAGLKDAVTPVGKPEAAMPTLPVKPFAGTTVMVLVPPARVGVIVTLVGAAESVKVGSDTTVRLIVVVTGVRLPDVPVMVTVTVPTAAEALAVRVKTLVVVVLVGLKDAVTPLGRPVASKLTLPVNPFTGVTVMVLVPSFP